MYKIIDIKFIKFFRKSDWFLFLNLKFSRSVTTLNVDYFGMLKKVLI